jgi:hypothetical protein
MEMRQTLQRTGTQRRWPAEDDGWGRLQDSLSSSLPLIRPDATFGGARRGTGQLLRRKATAGSSVRAGGGRRGSGGLPPPEELRAGLEALEAKQREREARREQYLRETIAEGKAGTVHAGAGAGAGAGAAVAVMVQEGFMQLSSAE